jgi:hypothetical protein
LTAAHQSCLQLGGQPIEWLGSFGFIRNQQHGVKKVLIILVMSFVCYDQVEITRG